MSEQDLESIEPTDGEDTTSDKNETKQPDVEQLIAQKSHWREKAKKLETEVETLKSQVKPEPVKEQAVDDTWKQRIEFAVTHKEYDSEDINKLLVLSKGLGVDLEKAKEDPMFKSYYETKQKEAEATKATPASGRGPKVTPPKPISEMTRSEHEEYFRKVLGS